MEPTKHVDAKRVRNVLRKFGNCKPEVNERSVSLCAEGLVSPRSEAPFNSARVNSGARMKEVTSAHHDE